MSTPFPVSLLPTTWPLAFTATASLNDAAEGAEINHPAGRRPRERMHPLSAVKL